MNEASVGRGEERSGPPLLAFPFPRAHPCPLHPFLLFVSPWVSGWKCSKCDMRENLWLNLTDGSILCGRRYFDGSGGNNHAVEHYRETGYPLAVKLGTITPDGAGTLYPQPLPQASPPTLHHHHYYYCYCYYFNFFI